MQNPSRSRLPVALAMISGDRIPKWIVAGARRIFWPLALLTLVVLAIQFGAWRIKFNIAGPFAAETNPARDSLILTVPKEDPADWWRQPLIGDTNEKPFQSNLELRIGDRELGPPHSQHEEIRDGTTAGFSHWGSYLIFSLPPGVGNVPETIATLRYSVRPRAWVTLVLTVLCALLGGSLYHQPLRSLARRYWALTSPARRYAEPLTAVILRIPYLVMAGLCGVGLTGSTLFLASSLYALAMGWALPTTAIIRWSPIGEWAARNEPYLGYLLLMVAGSGVLVTWLFGSNTRHRRLVRSNERWLRRLLALCGFPIVASCFVFCISAMWAGILRPGDPNSANISGLVPFSDAANYLTAAYDQAKDGVWNDVALHRPLAAAFRSVLVVFGNFSLPVSLVLQACLLAAATCFASHAVAKWRGVWSGIAFAALTYIYARYFVPTTLTEALGLFWALLSIPFFIAAFRESSVKPALLGFAMTTVALMTRMGSMFTIPALLVWLVWKFGQDAKSKLRIVAAALSILFGILGLNSLLQTANGAGPAPIPDNLAYTLCGLTIGTTWDGCAKKLASEHIPVSDEEAARAKQIYSMAWENFRARPSVLFYRIAENVKTFVTEFPEAIWKGYGRVPEPDWMWRNTLAAMTLSCLLYMLVRAATATELSFWGFFWISIVASASIIYPDDGARTLVASQPLVALFLATGASIPVSLSWKSRASPPMTRYGCLGLVAASVLFVCVPWLAHRFSPIEAMAGTNLLPKQDEAYVFGGRRMTGFLVVEDGMPLRSDIPTIHLTDFEAIVRQSGIETNQELLHPVAPPLPFGFIFAPRLEKSVLSIIQYIVPAEVIERRAVPAWHFRLEPWIHKPNTKGEYWFHVTEAKAWP